MADEQLPHDLRLSIGRLARRLRAQKADHTISDSQFSVLATLKQGGDCTIGSLSDSEKVTPPSMNRTINALESAGYVARNSAPDDGRKVVISLTPAGQELIEQTALRRDAWFVERLQALDPAKRAALEAAASVIKELADS